MEQPSDLYWLALLEKSLSDKLPNDVVLEILMRLPIKSVLRFKSVSKLWYYLFSHPNFARIHLKEAISGTHYLLFRHMVLEEKEGYVWRVHRGSSDSDIMIPAEDQEVDPDPSARRLVYQGKLWNERERFSLRSRENVEELRRLRVPTPSSTSYYTLVGCFNGLVCLNESNFSDTYHTLKVSFWNPVTRELRSLPRYYTRNRRLSGSLLVVGIGFGYEPVTDDYKVVRLIYFNRSKSYEAETYSIRRNSWKKISAENIHGCYFPQHVPQATINGALHWMVYKDRDYVSDSEFIVAFRLDQETLSKISLPTINPEDRVAHICKRVSVFENKLALFTHFPLAPDKKFTIWVMTEYGNANSWTPLRAVRQEEFMVPLHFVGNNLVIMKRKKDGEMIVGDSEFKRIRDLNVSSWCRVADYFESLVSPKPWKARVRDICS